LKERIVLPGLRGVHVCDRIGRHHVVVARKHGWIAAFMQLSSMLAEPKEIRRGLPGDPDDTHSRCIEAFVNGIVIGCIYTCRTISRSNHASL
jgi:exonuclease III